MLEVADVQNKLDKATYRYFHRLSKVGYTPYKEVEPILILDYINDMITKCVLSVDDKLLLRDALSCISGTCLIPYSSCK